MTEPDYRLYTSEEGAARIGGGIKASLLDYLASNQLVEATIIGRKIRWTDDQLRSAVSYHARGPAADGAEQRTRPAPSAAAASRTTRTARAHPPAGAIAPITSKPGRRYQQAGR